MRTDVVTFPGALDDGDAACAVCLAGGGPVVLWHVSDDVGEVNTIVLPGGFSYGDYLRCEAIAALTPVMSTVVETADKGIPVLGICNGFQILREAHLLPGVLIRNEGQRSVCRKRELAVKNADAPRTSDFTRGQVITTPLKNGEGCFRADVKTVACLGSEGRVAFRYVGISPNGLVDDIVGVVSESGNVVRFVLHPGHVAKSGLGPGDVNGLRSGTDRLTFFISAPESVPA